MTIKTIKILLTTLLVISPFSFAFQLTLAKEVQPRYVHLSWQNDTATTMTVSWNTIDLTSSIVHYGVDNSYGNEATGAEGSWHHVELTSLNPDTVYHYRVGNGKVWSTDSTFKTGTLGVHARFVAWGDSRTNRPERKEIMNTVNTLEFDFSVFDGDLVESGRDVDQWYNWFADFSPLLKHIPFMSVLGNHENNHSNFYNVFAYPGKEEYYSFNYGPIHFIGLHTCVPDYGGTFDEQIDWLLTDLDVNKNYKWKIVIMHRPAYSSSLRNYNGDYEDIQTLLVPIFEEHNITMVVSGHDHWYERLQKNNITYIVAGAAGAPLYEINEFYKIEESMYAESVLHAVFLEVYENQIDLRTFKSDRTIIDQYTINKESKPDLRCNNLPFIYSVSKNDSQDITITISNIGEVNITEATKARVEISTGESWEITIPPLNISESVSFEYDWEVPDKELYTWTVTVDTENQINEIEEDNNQIKFYFDAREPEETEKTSFFAEGIWSFIAALSTIIAVVIIKKKRKK